jgi:hypothetical protein
MAQRIPLPHRLDEAVRRFAIIEPLIARDRYLALWKAFNKRKGGLMRFLALRHKVSSRTLYLWVSHWRRGGLPGLVRRHRRDRGFSRVLNRTAFNFLRSVVGSSKPPTGVEVFQAYNQEREYRAVHIGSVVGKFDRVKYKDFIDRAGRLTEGARLPAVKVRTLQHYYSRVKCGFC